MRDCSAFGWIVAALLILLPLPARAQSSAAIAMADPAAYSREIAERMSAQGVEPLRPLLTQMYATQIGVSNANVQLPPQLDAQFATIQTLIAGRRATVTRRIGDVVAGDALRSIFYYHYFGDNVWVFTRFNFVRVGEDQWALSMVIWGGTENIVGLAPQPMFEPVN